MQKLLNAFITSVKLQLVSIFIFMGLLFTLLFIYYSTESTTLLIGVTASLAATVVAVMLVLKIVITPLEKLGTTTDMLASASTPPRIDIRAKNDFGRVAANINALTRRIKEGQRAVDESGQLKADLARLQVDANELQLSYNNTIALSEIGQKLSSTLSLEEIVNTLYESINSMMDAAAFGLGMYEETAQALTFKLSLEKGNRLPPYSIPLSDKGSIAVWCVANRKDAFMNDVEQEYSRYVYPLTMVGGSQTPHSAIFCPMLVGSRIIGVICVQSFRKNAYTPYHLDMLHALAAYTAVALDNAHAYQELNIAMGELKEAQSQLVQSEKMASLGQLTAGIAHEINNPINFVSANVGPLQRDIGSILEVLEKYSAIRTSDGLTEKLAEIDEFKEEIELGYVVEEINQLIRGIEDGARRTAEIVRGLRNFSRVDESDLKKADIHEGIDSTLVLLHSNYKERIEVIKDYNVLPQIECYPGQINQVFMNLLTNAIQAIPDRGTITIRTTRQDKSICIRISDSGVGIPEEMRRKVFDPFFTTKDVGKGTGLGLSISLGIIRKHNGTLDVESEVGKGTTFIITLPIAQTSAHKGN